MSLLRPTLKDAVPGTYTPSGGTAYMMVMSSVKEERGLLHGKLEDGERVCAIGSYFNTNHKTALTNSLIDEVAAVNDSVPHMTPLGRKRHVVKWLKWKLTTLGFTGYESPKKKKGKR